jgi:uncharacterized coiled-coil DUF342 family protein
MLEERKVLSMSITQVRFGGGCHSSKMIDNEPSHPSSKKAMKALRKDTAKLNKLVQPGSRIDLQEVEKTISRLEGNTSTVAKQSDRKLAKKITQVETQLDQVDKAVDSFVPSRRPATSTDPAVEKLMEQMQDLVKLEQQYPPAKKK